MNYLAHAVLSGGDYQILAGNLLADQIKGQVPNSLPMGVRRGIMLHRKLDAFTDNHAVFRKSRMRLKGGFGHYSGVIVDVIYDHFLARNMERFTNQSLLEFATWADACFRECRELIPEAVQPRWSGLLWLQEYAETAGIERAFRRISSRSRRSVDLSSAVDMLEPHLAELDYDFCEFFPDAILAEQRFLKEIHR